MAIRNGGGKTRFGLSGQFGDDPTVLLMRSLVTCLAGPIAEEIAAGREPRNLDPTAALLEEQPPIRYGPDGQCYSSAAQWARHFLKDGDYERAYAAFDELAPLARARAIELVRGQWHMKAASASVRR